MFQHISEMLKYVHINLKYDKMVWEIFIFSNYTLEQKTGN